MKKLTFTIVLAVILFVSTQNSIAQTEKKAGWGFGALPCATYSSDMGFQYGVFGDFYYYGDGSDYPNYKDKISYEVSHFTKGRTRLYLSHDSKHLIPKVRTTLSATYIDDPLYNFWGFNGTASPMSKTDSYHFMDRTILRILADFQGKITPQIRWAGGINFWRFGMNDVDQAKYGYDPSQTMYYHYKKSGMLKESEMNGGSRLEFKGGLVFDSRDIECAPNKGIWAELYVNGSPDIFKDGFNYLKLNAHFRQYITIPIKFKAGEPVFAYHLAYQGTIAGEAPFYMQQNITALILKQMMSEGLGSGNTIRGTRANRIIADSYAWGNFELRVKLFRFKLFGQNFYLATNPFLDCGMIVKPYRVKEMSKLPEIIASASNAGYAISDTEDYVRKQASQFIYTGGIGLKIAWNENFIVSIEAAHNFNSGLGNPFWMSIGTNYCF